jgi:hypothetical protein
MKTAFRYATATALTGALVLATASPSQAWRARNAAAIGFGVGAVTGAVVASSAYNNGYGYYGYYGDPGYVYDSYAYEPSYAYVPAPRYGYYDNWSYEHSTNNFAIESQR